MPRIVLEGVLKSFAGADGKSVTAVDCLTLAVENREMLAIVGPSGCGKTTTLRLIAGLESPDAGNMRFDDLNVTMQPPINRDVAMVFQSHALFPHLSAFDNITFGLRLRRVSKGEISARVREMAEQLDIANCLDRKPGKLSGGERQRVALARALVRRPQILLLDEPFSHLDGPLRIQLQTELLALRSRLEMTVIYVTHDQAEALALGDRVAVLRDGKLQQIGLPHEIYEMPANTFVAGFIGSPPMNLFHGTIVRRESGLILVAGETASASPAFIIPLNDWRTDWFSQNVGRQVLLGVRPESIKFAGSNEQTATNGTITAVVQSLQYLGAETHLHLRVGEMGVTVRHGSHCTFRAGQTITLAFDLSRARAYDAATGKALF